MCCLASTLIGMALVFALKSTYDPNSRPATTAGVYCKFGWYIINGATTLVLSGGGAATDKNNTFTSWPSRNIIYCSVP